MDRLTAMASFVRTVEHGSFAGAAAAAGLSPAMIGNHVRFLEERLGEPLLNRSTRHQVLTEFGRDYYARCRNILEDVEAAEAAGGASRPSAGVLRVTAPVVLGGLMLTDPITRYVRGRPQSKIELLLRDERIDLLSERIDVALRIGDVADSSMMQRALPPLALVMCASRGYLERRGRPERPSDLEQHDCLDFLTQGRSVWRLRPPGRVVLQPISGPLRANSGLALRSYVLAGLGIALLPDALVREDIESGVLCGLLEDHPAEALDVRLLALPGRMQTAKVRPFVDAVAEAFASQAPPTRRMIVDITRDDDA